MPREEVLEKFCEFGVSKGNDDGSVLLCCGRSLLIYSKRLKTLAQDHQRLVNITSFSKTFARGLSIFRTLRTSEVDNTQFGGLFNSCSESSVDTTGDSPFELYLAWS
jgi:hypothetical protein